MINNEKKVKKYNELIKLSLDIMMIWKKGNYTHKAIQIENCKKDIAFYKMMKSRIITEKKI